MPNTNQRETQRTVVRPRPTKLSGVAMIVAGAVFLLFSAVPFSAAEGEARPFVLIFGGVWVLVCLSFIVYGIHIVTSDRPAVGVVLEVEGAPPGSAQAQAPSGDFEARLRSLEKLRQDRLITEEEYQKKRAEIMSAPW